MTTHGLGYDRVDDDPNLAVLLETTDATARWDATVRLRAWERHHLNLKWGQRLLDVGCGLGDAALALAAELGSGGEVVGIDASSRMIAGAQTRARSATCRARFTVGDALALAEPADSFDVVRCERTLQWLSDPSTAVSEMVRVLRPGGLLSLIDTDWSTFHLDVGDDAIARRVREALQVERRRPSNVGRRLVDIVDDAGLRLVGRETATQRWDAWDPDQSPAPDGCFSMSSLAEDLVDTDHLHVDDQEWFVSTVHAAAREGRFSMELTMFAVVAAAPETRERTSDDGARQA